MKSLCFVLCENGTIENSVFESIRIMKNNKEMSCNLINHFTFKLDLLREDVYRITSAMAYEKTKRLSK